MRSEALKKAQSKYQKKSRKAGKSLELRFTEKDMNLYLEIKKEATIQGKSIVGLIRDILKEYVENRGHEN